MSKDLLYKAAYLIPEDCSYSTWETRAVGTVRSVPELGTVTLVKNERSTDGWSETENMELIFEVRTQDGQLGYFKKRGYEDSYGSETWDGNVVPVEPATKTIITYTEV